tara:strand:- start:474 stop:1007 length:534 start_codon:yes stop_codon:yes gene_type:complete
MLINPIFSQTKTEILCYDVDEFDDSKSLSGGTSIMYTDGGDLRTEGLLFSNIIDEKKNKINKVNMVVYVYDKKIRCTDDGNTLDILFEDGSKTQLVNWKKFNCDGVNYFNMSESQTNDLKTKRIKGLRYTDKRNYNTITIKENLSEENKTFYINLYKEIDNVNNGTSTISICKKEDK